MWKAGAECEAECQATPEEPKDSEKWFDAAADMGLWKDPACNHGDPTKATDAEIQKRKVWREGNSPSAPEKLKESADYPKNQPNDMEVKDRHA